MQMNIKSVIDGGLINDYDHLMKYLRNIWKKNGETPF